MKKQMIHAALAAVALLSYSCAFDDNEIVYDYTSALFPYQDYNRNIMVGEGLSLNVGITLAGVLDNKKDRVIQYIIDPSLITESDKSILPSSYYKCENTSQMVIPKNSLKGYMHVGLDSALFLGDEKSLTGEYVLPIRLVSSSDVDSISPDLGFIRISISYYARQHGYYTYSGTIVKTKGGNVTTAAYSNQSSVTDSRRFLNTAGPDRFRVEADATNGADPANGAYTFLLDVPVSGGGNVAISPDPDSPVKVYPDGVSAYDVASKTFTLNYTYTATDGTVCDVSESLVFRNRIRDVQSNGLYINEWRGF
ncbi:MAG: DUF1735 domain-containing protein [Tannerella sp.]|jgi:hypothetical protein|nr:DUF1735 domain-containing protein [Tannerella sp.]